MESATISRSKGSRHGSSSSHRTSKALKMPRRPFSFAPVNFNSQIDEESNKDESSTSRTSAPPALHLMTTKLIEIFAQCNPSYHYDRRLNPRRVLTKPSRATYNSGYDNERHDYILYVNDILGNEESKQYCILDLLGQGTFGQVVKCQNTRSGELVAIKVIKNQPAFFNQSMMEVTVLEMLNQKYDRSDKRHVIRMRDTFVFRQHLCIVVELLSLNLYELIKQNQYRGFSLTLCRMFLAQLVDALKVLKEARIIHCDLKPENILLRNLESPSIKVIDFGSACHEHQTLYTYIQSRFYRSPEVLLGLPYSASIDVWSLGCIAAELFLGLPIFPGASNYDQVSRIVATLGVPPTHMIEVGKDAYLYFERTANSRSFRPNPNTSAASSIRRTSLGDNSALSMSIDTTASSNSNRHRSFSHQSINSSFNAELSSSSPSAGSMGPYRLKSREQYSMETGKHEAPPKQYFVSADLRVTVMNHPLRPRDMSESDRQTEMRNRECFLDLLRGLLAINPLERWTPHQIAQHPFITGKSFAQPFAPMAVSIESPSMISQQKTLLKTTSPVQQTRQSPSQLSVSSLLSPEPPATTAGDGFKSSASRSIVKPIKPTTTMDDSFVSQSMMATDTTTEADQRTMASRRQRSNTLSSLSIQDIPSQIQRIAAAAASSNTGNTGSKALPVQDRQPDAGLHAAATRIARNNVSNQSMEAISESYSNRPSLPLEQVAASMQQQQHHRRSSSSSSQPRSGSLSSSLRRSSSGGGTLSFDQPLAPKTSSVSSSSSSSASSSVSSNGLSSTHQAVEHIVAYASHRRASQPGISIRGSNNNPRGNSSTEQERDQIIGHSGTAYPMSLPNTAPVWGSTSAIDTKGSNSKAEDQSRLSRRSLTQSQSHSHLSSLSSSSEEDIRTGASQISSVQFPSALESKKSPPLNHSSSAAVADLIGANGNGASPSMQHMGRRARSSSSALSQSLHNISSEGEQDDAGSISPTPSTD